MSDVAKKVLCALYEYLHDCPVPHEPVPQISNHRQLGEIIEVVFSSNQKTQITLFKMRLGKYCDARIFVEQEDPKCPDSFEAKRACCDSWVLTKENHTGRPELDLTIIGHEIQGRREFAFS